MQLILLSTIFTTLLLTANITAVKIIAVGTEGIDAGIIAYPFTFLISDVISEVYGRKTTTKIIWLGFLANIIMIVVIFTAGSIPSAVFWNHQESYDQILGSVPRIVAASMLAYIISQNHDVFAFEMWRNLTGGKFLWLRNNASTIISQGIDTVIFVLVAFTGTYSNSEMWNMILITYIIKVLIATADTPLVYLIVYITKANYQGLDWQTKN
jgi:uncharacterized integral membrane protein (TIGR00697 family)